MSTARLPFSLAPVAGESFDSWLQAYAAHLEVPVVDLSRALGLPPGYTTQSTRTLLRKGLQPVHLAAISEATGITEGATSSMFPTDPPRPTFASNLVDNIRATLDSIATSWTGTNGTRFCSGCLATNGGRYRLAWRLPWTFACPEHQQVLVEVCARCGQHPRTRLQPHQQVSDLTHCQSTVPVTGHGRNRCGADLADATHASSTTAADAFAAQLVIDGLIARANCPAAGDDAVGEAVDVLTDLAIIAFHLNGSPPSTASPRVRADMLRADTLTPAVELFGREGAATSDVLLASLVASRAGTRARAIPESWRAGSPALAARVAHSRDDTLTAVERLRYATTLSTPQPAPTNTHIDAAIERASRLPDQLWSVWAVRLLADDSLDPTIFRTAMAAALLLPHSRLTLTEIMAMLGGQVHRHTVEHQITVLAKTAGGKAALRILTELSVAIDHHDIPIDYHRRRRLVATAALISSTTWKRLANTFHHMTGHDRRHEFARRYLYELLTAGSLARAPEPYTLPDGLLRFEYHDFVLGLPAGLANALAEHARDLLTTAGITNEPLQWHPPTHWISVQDWPGVDPDRTDPAAIHQALMQGTPSSHIAKTLGLSIEHLRYVVRQHPLPGPDQPDRRPGAITPLGSPGQWHADAGGVFHLNVDWLREQYVTWHRTLVDIAHEVGCTKASLMAFAKRHAIPTRKRSGGRSFIAHRAVSVHPAELPDLLRTALTGQNARQRVDRFLAITEHRSLVGAARAIGANQAVLSQTLTRLERQCKGSLIHRGAPRLGELTPLGQQLRDQALRHLFPTASGSST